ncbi:DNA primase [Candidatus Woesearchaeota archaeon]|nr:MAG: DNA primase [Candidatus Woesearchaeota archaeon]
MAKIAQVSAKYIIHASIFIDGVVDRPDVIGAIFGQTEGLLGADLELRELQRSGRIGRIEVNVDTKGGKTRGEIIIPSSLDKAETAIVAAALEIIQRIGPCNAKIQVQEIEDIRISKRQHVISRAKELLKNLMDSVMPDSQELADEVAYSVRVMEITEYGRERLPAGPAIEESDEVILVEGRADVLNLLKHGFKNAIAINGTNVPESIIELTKRKVVTVFVDGDRGGDLIIKEVFSSGGEIDFVTKAPDGKEVEELTKKEIHKALRSKVAAEQYKLEAPVKSNTSPRQQRPAPRQSRNGGREEKKAEPRTVKKLSDSEKKKFGQMLEDLIGTRGAYLLDEKLNILGKVPVTELQSTIKSLRGGVYSIIFDGVVDKDLLQVADRANVAFVAGMSSKVKSSGQVQILTADDF